jgi:NAD(P)-dependent dehydrogenase (short-subunit alcohol dehydrogenase family)
MEHLGGRVAVVTGGAGGLGLALGERFAREGMKVVLADVQPGPLEAAVSAVRQRGGEATGVVTDVMRYESVEALRDKTLDTYGAVHLVCNNAGIGAGAEGRLWEHEINDWRWALAVNLWGVVHGINAFVPTLLAQGDEGHVVNTSSGNGGIAPLPTTPVVTLTECLYAQLQDVGGKVGASVLFPGPHMLRTGIFESWRYRPGAYAKERPRATPYITIEDLEQQMKTAGVEVQYTPVEDVAGRVVDAVRANDFWIMPPSQRIDDQIRARAESMLKRENPVYLREVPG